MTQKWKLIGSYTVRKYKCGLKAGDRVRLLKEIIVKQGEKPTGEVWRAGEIWNVLTGAKEDPGVVWLMRPNGKRAVWGDNMKIYEWFVRVGSEPQTRRGR